MNIDDLERLAREAQDPGCEIFISKWKLADAVLRLVAVAKAADALFEFVDDPEMSHWIKHTEAADAFRAARAALAKSEGDSVS